MMAIPTAVIPAACLFCDTRDGEGGVVVLLRTVGVFDGTDHRVGDATVPVCDAC